jgi:predicted ribosomally synthesized peptide with SipW-like signal peptide
MKKIIASLTVIVLVALISVGATVAYFSDTATITGNTFSTGTLEIRVNGEPSVVGASFTGVAPGDMKVSPVYGIQNFGPPWFGGPSNLTANSMYLTVANPDDGGSGLWQEVKVKIEVGRLSGVMQHELYNGLLKDMGTLDLFGGHWSSLIAGSTQDMKYTVWLPETGLNQNTLMGKTLTWDFVIEARTN